MKKTTWIIYLAASLVSASCEILDDDIDRHTGSADSTYIRLNEEAEILSALPLHISQMEEVHQTVTSSSDNGYDEEYTMKDLFESPGQGVGSCQTRSGLVYETPLRELITEYVHSKEQVKSTAKGYDAEEFLYALTSSDIQIYWPFSENWDGETMPIITFDPEDGTDAEFTTLEMLRREDPEWGEGGGTIIVKPETKAASEGKSLRSLILKDFTMNRNYDSWFAGASEFFVKTGSLDDFTASTEAELRLFNPLVTDFMIVVRRSQLGKPQPFNAVLVSDWNPQMTHCALMGNVIYSVPYHEAKELGMGLERKMRKEMDLKIK